uniref:Secreted protein n=1 Tax=Anguilla anguilla TaxID=7936 RepID=A0A0E9VYS0_ANGAN
MCIRTAHLLLRTDFILQLLVCIACAQTCRQGCCTCTDHLICSVICRQGVVLVYPCLNSSCARHAVHLTWARQGHCLL